MTGKGAASAAPGLLSGAYRTVWRWHFYAGLLVLPVLMLMALTGGLYLFKSEIDDALYRGMAQVAPAASPASPDQWRAAAEQATDGTATSVLMPDRSDRAVRFGVALADAPTGVGWTMEGMVMSAEHAAPARLSTVIATAERESLARPYQVSIPAGPALAFTAARQVDHVEDTRALYIDGTTGVVKADIGYAAFGPGARAIEWGIATHQGAQYGQINRFVMLGGCIAIWLLGVSAGVMWWKRRPPGRLAAPVAPPGPRARTAVLAIVLPLAILYPLTGLSLIVAVALDRLIWFLNRPRPAAS